MKRVKNPADVRTIISATQPRRFRDRWHPILMKAWFEELPEPIEVLASPFDIERHSKELWVRAMAGQYGPIEVIPEDIGTGIAAIMIFEDNTRMLSIAEKRGDEITVRGAKLIDGGLGQLNLLSHQVIP